MKAEGLIICFLALIPAVQADPLDHWTVAPSGLPSNITSIAYGEGKFVAVGGSAASTGWLAFSMDLQHWTLATCDDQPCAPRALLGVTFANGRFVAVGDFGWTYWSTNGVGWHLEIVPPTDSLLFDVTYAAGKFVTVGEQEACPCAIVATSTDGMEWSPNFLESLFRLRAVAFGNARFVAVGLLDDATSNPAQNVVMSVNSFATWITTATDGEYNLFGVTFGQGLFAAVGEERNTGHGCIVTSSDGLTWATAVLPTTNALRSISFVQGLFVATGASGTLLTSTNGVSWCERVTNQADSLGRTFFADGRMLTLSVNGDWLKSDPLVRLQISRATPAELIVSGLEGRSYRIEASGTVPNDNWDDLGTLVLYNSPTLWRDGTAAPNARFYRAVLLP